MSAIALPPCRLLYPRGFSEDALRRALEQFPAHRELREIARMFGGAFQRPFQSAVAAGDAVAGPWYLAGGIALANCIAAYQPKGAASLAASYVNLATPGTNNAAPGTAPTFDAATGWTFNGSSQYLIAPVTPGAGWSFFVQYTNADVAGGNWIGCARVGPTTRFQLCPGYEDTVYYGMGGEIGRSPALSGGNLGMAGQTAYRNGTSDGTIPSGTVCTDNPFLGARQLNGAAASYLSCKIQAVAFYNTTLTGPQAAALAAAMAAL